MGENPDDIEFKDLRSEDGYDDDEPVLYNERPTVSLPLKGLDTPQRQWGAIGVFGVVIFLMVLFAALYLSSSKSPLDATSTFSTFSSPMTSTSTSSSSASAPPSVIFFIADGYGPASATLARTLSEECSLPLDDMVMGSVRTKSTSSLITDSAAGATAYACAHKTYNAAIAVLGNHTACGTMMEAAKASGIWKTALVTTSRITHATPASWSAHVKHRDMEFEIAAQQARQQDVDLLLGGGLKQFTSRPDRADLFREMRQRGYTTTNDLATFRSLTSADLPLIGLFNHDHITWEIDRRRVTPQQEPSLSEMVSAALRLLSDAGQPFFMMVEAARIDLAEHQHDAAAERFELQEYMRSVKLVKEFVDAHPNTLVIAVADHETGGLSLGNSPAPPFVYPAYQWEPSVILAVNASAEFMANKIYLGASAQDTFSAYTSIDDLDAMELTRIEDALQIADSSPYWLPLVIADVICDRAGLGWSTPGHSGVDVTLHQYGKIIPALRGNVENCCVGGALRDHLGLTEGMAQVTQALASVYDPASGTTFQSVSSTPSSSSPPQARFFSHD